MLIAAAVLADLRLDLEQHDILYKQHPGGSDVSAGMLDQQGQLAKEGDYGSSNC